MNETEDAEYTELIKELYLRLENRNKIIEFLRDKLDDLSDYQNTDEHIKKLEILLKESKLDRELSNDLQNMLEVEHFLENGNGQNFDPEY
jgi:hypothetical protein